MDNNHFHPISGQIYQNHNGIKYLCLESEGFSNEGLFISVSSGYVLLAHGCKQNDDGSIEWNCSEDKGFHDVHKFSELYGFDSTGKSIVSQDDDEPSTWAEVIKIEFEGVRAELESLVYYDTKQRCFNENINPTTYDQLMESAEMNALEQYTEDERFPEWNEEAEYLFRTEYINKIKPLAEEWEAGIMYHAKLVDEHEKGSPAFGDETATEYFTDYFNRFWGRE